MSSAQQTGTLAAGGAIEQGPTASSGSLGRMRVRTEHLALGAVLALSAVLNINRLSQNGWANAFYSAGVKSMLKSLHNFFFVSFDPGGLVTVDKPPLGLWVQAASAKVFGLTPLAVLLPEAIASVITVGVLYWAVRPRFGATAAVASALVLAVFPSLVAVSRDNNLDAILILLMTLACGVGLRAIESGRLRTLLGCAVLVGLAFNTKTLAGYLVVPGLAAGYLVCAPGPPARRVWHMLAAGAVMLVVSGLWIAAVELTPASQRPFVGGSTNNTELGLTFGYNGFGRVGGQVGGPGQIPKIFKHGSLARIEQEALEQRAHGHSQKPSAPAPNGPAPLSVSPTAIVPAIAPHKPKPSPYLPNGRARNPTAFGGPTSPVRLFGVGLGTQGGWMLPFAFAGLLAIALLTIGARHGAVDGPSERQAGAGADPGAGVEPGAGPGAGVEPPEAVTEVLATVPAQAQGAGPELGGDGSPRGRVGRRDPRLAGLLVLGGWFLVEFTVLSFSKGIVHPYYVSALGPGTAAMVGAGAVAFLAPGQFRRLRLALIPLAVAATVAAQILLLHNDREFMRWFWPVLVIGAVVGVAATLGMPRQARLALALTLALLLVTSVTYSASTWYFTTEGTFPAAGPHAAGGVGYYGAKPDSQLLDDELLSYLRKRPHGSRWIVLAEASDTVSPMILLGYDAAAMGGYSGNDPALNGPKLARLVRRNEARYMVLGGSYAERGGNAASTAVLRACELIPSGAWQPPPVNRNGLLLFDCKGHEAALSRS